MTLYLIIITLAALSALKSLLRPRKNYRSIDERNDLNKTTKTGNCYETKNVKGVDSPRDTRI